MTTQPHDPLAIAGIGSKPDRTSSLDRILREVANREGAFYDRAIELHENAHLRSAAGIAQSIAVYKRPGYGTNLLYTRDGFRIDDGIYRDSDYRDPGWWSADIKTCKVKNGKLYAHGKGMLEHFPELTLDELESGLEQAISRLEIMKGGNP